MTTRFESCQFINCGDSDEQCVMKKTHPESTLELFDCTFSFDDVTRSCKAVYLISSNLKVDRCTFDKCGSSTLSIQATGSSNGIFEFTNNIVQNCNKQCIVTNNLKTKPIVSGNIFQKVNLIDSYFIVINHNQEEVTLFNNTFSEITATGETVFYGGGISIWIPRSEKQKHTLTFEQCKFYDIINNKNNNPCSNGGAIQYGYTSTISNVTMIFNECEFKRNKCQNGNGGALAIDIHNNLQISSCIFENNEATNGYGGSIYVWGSIVENDVPKNSEMESLSITNCQFTRNKGSDGHILYIEDSDDILVNVELDISLCSFVDNGEDNAKYMIVDNCKNLVFEHNTIKYTDSSKSSGSIKLNKCHLTTINNCTFSNSQDNGCIDFANWDDFDQVANINKCEFVNCKSADSFNIKLMYGNCNFDSITISFDDVNNGCGGIQFQEAGFTLNNCKFIKTNSRNGGINSNQQFDGKPISIIGCTFDHCEGYNKRCFDLTLRTDSIIFKNCTIQNMEASDERGYFGSFQLNIQIPFIKFDEIIFINNNCKSWYGGGTGLWVTKTTTIEFYKCKFINNVALKSIPRDEQPIDPNNNIYCSGDGGAIQFGFTNSTYDSNLIFNECEFRENKAVRHGGALALQNVGTVDINKCIFENNIANYNPPSTKLLDFGNYYDQKSEGRGGAIYLNPAFNHLNSDKTKHMQDVNIKGCNFNSNDAFDGYAIYIEGDDPGNSFSITGNDFVDNHDGTDKTKSMIVSEIHRLDENSISNGNDFKNKNPDVIVPPLIFVDHNAQPESEIESTSELTTQTSEPKTPTSEPKTPTSIPKTQTSIPKTPTSIPEVPTDGEFDDDVFELINASSKGRHEYIYTDQDTSYLIVVFISHFYNIHSVKDGGAIHITNAGIKCNNTLFENCTTSLAGGGLYLRNDLNNKNKVTLFNNNFTECKALYGGGIYVYSSNRNNNVQISACTFHQNEATAKSTDGGKYGGSGIYATIKKGKVKDCDFYDVPGDGSFLKLDNSIETKKSSLKILNLIKKKPSFIISGCNFNFLENEPATGVFFVRGKSDNLVELNGCSFNGKLAKESRYIDGEIVSNDSPKLIVKNCRFADSQSNAVTLDSNYISIDTKQQVFGSNIATKSRKKASAVVVAATLLIAAIAIIGFVLIGLRSKENTLSEENEISFETSSDEVENDI